MSKLYFGHSIRSLPRSYQKLVKTFNQKVVQDVKSTFSFREVFKSVEKKEVYPIEDKILSLSFMPPSADHFVIQTDQYHSGSSTCEFGLTDRNTCK